MNNLTLGQSVTWGGQLLGGKPSRVYHGVITAIKPNHRIGLDVTVKHDHGGVQTLTSIRPDYFN